MSHCGPRNAIPSCAAIPNVGFGSSSCGFSGLGGFGCGFGGFGTGAFGSLGSGGSVSATSLGVLQGVQPKCINQLLPQEVVIQPPPIAMTIPGAIMSATPEPIRVGASAPCAAPGFGSIFGSGGFSGLGFNNRGFLGSQGSVCLNPGFDVCH
ncbi:hypothetical protein JRQ81_009275 [Phrynocephalus forsythii]|uniref:Uncharacterized protein n=1 Tax=Phrynocephalus forsythii TaxID=171643 RepID=A0A9Q0XBJ3_9SAUR|nr:hypothetical protein JRQ81_009275 [Phrynocephalus forsythii]